MSRSMATQKSEHRLMGQNDVLEDVLWITIKLQGTVRPYPTKREVWKIIDSKVPAGRGYGFGPRRVKLDD